MERRCRGLREGPRAAAPDTPAKVYRVLADLLEPLSPAAGNLMAMSWVESVCGTEFDGRPLAERFGVRLTDAEAFLRTKAALPPEA